MIFKLKITSFQPPLAPPWALTTRVGRGCAEFPTKSSWLCAEEQQQEHADVQCCKKEPQEWEPSPYNQLFST